MSIHDYEHPALTADVVLLTLGDGDISVLLVQRGNPPFEGQWAFPGGFVDVGEAPQDAAARELREETGIQGLDLTQLHAFGTPRRDPRGHVVSIAYLSVIHAHAAPPVRHSSDARDARWWSVRHPPTLAFDHDQILTCALARLRRALNCRLEAEHLPIRLPGELSVDDLRAGYRIIAETLGDGA